MIEIIPDAGRLAEYAELAGEHSLGFEYNDFYMPDLLDDGAALRERLSLYRGLARPAGQDTMHGVFFDIVPFSWDSGIRRHSVRRMRQSMEIAGELGCRAVVFHTGLLPGLVGDEKYLANWLERTEETIRELLDRNSGVDIYYENMFDETPAELKTLALALRDEERFGVCLDVAHMMLGKESPEVWLRELAPYIRHLHLNDNHLERDEHLPLGEGKIDWEHLFELMRRHGILSGGDGGEKASFASVLLELRGLDKIRKSLDFVRGYLG